MLPTALSHPYNYISFAQSALYVLFVRKVGNRKNYY